MSLHQPHFKLCPSNLKLKECEVATPCMDAVCVMTVHRFLELYQNNISSFPSVVSGLDSLM